MKLSPRLKKIYDSINGYSTLADIGSDHAYLPICLVKSGKIKSAIASDINKGPVEISKKRIRENGLQDLIEVRHGSGLSILKTGEVEVIVIAGMGGLLITDILEDGKEKAKSAKLLVLQPMRDSDAVRKWLIKNGLSIEDEELVKDEGKIYEIIWTTPYESEQVEDDYMLVGKKIIEKKHTLVLEFLDKRIKETAKVIAQLEEVPTGKAQEKKEELYKILNYYEELRKWVE